MAEKTTFVIDAHHHLWRYVPDDYPWIDDSMSALRRDFLPPDLQRECAGAQVDGTVAVQARQTIEETDWLLSLAEKSALIRGVIGWAPITSKDFASQVERLVPNIKLKGLRHVVQGEPDDNFINRPDFNRGIDALAGSGLVYDILILEKHLTATIQFVDRHPNQVFVLDHIAKPCIANGVIEPWKRNISELARRPNVYCKLSGIVTEANWSTWSERDLQPYVEVVLESFTPARLMFGSDWPVCMVATTYRRWLAYILGLTLRLSGPERERIMGETAIEVYRL